MTYVKIAEGGTAHYPYSVDDLKRDNPGTSFPADLAGTDLLEFGVVTLSVALDLLDDTTRVGLLTAAKAEKLSELATTRWGKETGGIALNGTPVATDRQSQAMINGALGLITADPTRLIDWKTATGWVQLDANMIQGIAFGIGAHVQACFSRERALSEAITAAATFEDLDAIDITAGWPT